MLKKRQKTDPNKIQPQSQPPIANNKFWLELVDDDDDDDDFTFARLAKKCFALLLA